MSPLVGFIVAAAALLAAIVIFAISGRRAARAEARVAGLEERLVEQEREKIECMLVVAHDLKGPLSVIFGWAETLVEKPDVPRDELLRMLKKIKSNAGRMTGLVENMLDLGALQRGDVVIETRAFEPSELARSVVESWRLNANTKGQTISLEPLPVSAAFISDPHLVRRILENLVSNAVKYSPQGTTVRVRVERTPEGVQYSVADDGPGFSEEDKSKLFGPFTKLSAQPTGGEHATGLGLSIVKKMTECLGGSVSCESEKGTGATFLVRIPASETVKPAGKPKSGVFEPV